MMMFTHLFIERYTLQFKQISFKLSCTSSTVLTIEIKDKDLKLFINGIKKQNAKIDFVSLDLTDLIPNEEGYLSATLIDKLSQIKFRKKQKGAFVLYGLDNFKELHKLLYEFNNVLDYPYPIIFCLSSFGIDRVIKELNDNFQSNYSFDDYCPNLISFK